MNNFKSVGSNAVGVTQTSVYTAPSLTTTTIIGMSVANVLTTSITVDIVLTKGGTSTYIVKGAPIAPGSSLVAIGGDQKLVLETGNILKVASSAATSADVIVSMLEVA